MTEDAFDQLLSKYANVVVHIGLNLRKGPRLLLRGNLDDAPLMRKVAECAYKAGAVYVEPIYTDERMDAELAITSGDPELLSGIDLGLIAANRKASMKRMEPLRR